MLCDHPFVGIVTGQYPLEESGGNVGGPLSQMSEAVNKIDNGANQANAGNGMGSSGNGLSASNEIFHNNKVRSLKVDITSKIIASTRIYCSWVIIKQNTLFFSWVHKRPTPLECQQHLTPLAHHQPQAQCQRWHVRLLNIPTTTCLRDYNQQILANSSR